MKVFRDNHAINFVDDNNVLVGFQYEQNCCETFGWRLSRDQVDSDYTEGENGICPEGFQFCVDFLDLSKGPEDDEGGEATFKLIKDGEVIFLKLWNHHNGYYQHGFSMTAEGKEVFEGSL